MDWRSSSSNTCLSSSHPSGGSVGGSHVVTPDVPFSVDDLISDHIFYVQDTKHQVSATQDTFSFYISDGHSQTEAFNVEIDIQVAAVCVLNLIATMFSRANSRVVRCPDCCMQVCYS